MESSSSEKFLGNHLKITIFQSNLCKNGVPMGHAQNKKQFVLEITRPHPTLSKPFYFNTISYVLAELWMFFYIVWCFFAKKLSSAAITAVVRSLRFTGMALLNWLKRKAKSGGGFKSKELFQFFVSLLVIVYQWSLENSDCSNYLPNEKRVLVQGRLITTL